MDAQPKGERDRHDVLRGRRERAIGDVLVLIEREEWQIAPKRGDDADPARSKERNADFAIERKPRARIAGIEETIGLVISKRHAAPNEGCRVVVARVIAGARAERAVAEQIVCAPDATGARLEQQGESL
jgi:hypothetical protein